MLKTGSSPLERNSDRRYSYTGATIFYPFVPGQGTTAVPGYGVNDSETSHLASLGYTRFISPTTLNEFRFGFTRVTSATYNQVGPQAATYGFNTGYPAGAPTGLGDIPNITFSGGLVSGVESTSNLGATGNNPSGNWINTLQWVDNFSHITPRHEWKFGGEVRNIRDNRLYDLYFNGQLGFTGSDESAKEFRIRWWTSPKACPARRSSSTATPGAAIGPPATISSHKIGSNCGPT